MSTIDSDYTSSYLSSIFKDISLWSGTDSSADDSSGTSATSLAGKFQSLLGTSDTDSTGALSQAESGLEADDFNALDKNGDGEVDEAEYVIDGLDRHAMQNELMFNINQLMSSMDSNASGSLGASEMSLAAMNFSSIDQDNSGDVDATELMRGYMQRTREIFTSNVERMMAEEGGSSTSTVA